MVQRRNDDAEKLLFANRAQWCRWLKTNHDKVSSIWMVYLKGAGAKECIAYDDAVEEALCWGWIDSIIKKVDDERYVRKFTPRRPGSIWSDLNKKRIAEMIKTGQMTPVGLARIEAAKTSGDWTKTSHPVAGLHDLPDFAKALAVSKRAGAFFESLAPSYKRQFLGWIRSAKQNDTRTRRIKEAISLLERSKKLGMK